MRERYQANIDSSRRDTFLNGFDDATQGKILRALTEHKIKDNDPVFPTLMVILGCQERIERGPNQIETAFDIGLRKVMGAVEDVKKVSCIAIEENISRAVASLIKQTEKEELNKKRSIRDMAYGAITAIILVAIGVIGSYPFYRSIFYVEPDPTGQRTISRSDAVLLEWSKSAAGVRAKQIAQWNPDIVDGCEAKAKGLGVRIRIGEQYATSGFCWLWVEPPGKRNYRPVK